MVEDVSLIGTYGWGSAILAHIFYALDIFSRRTMKSMDCFWQFIEVHLNRHSSIRLVFVICFFVQFILP